MNMNIKNIRKANEPYTPKKKKRVVKNTSGLKVTKLDEKDKIKNEDAEPSKMRDILIYLYEKYDGDWDDLYTAIQNKERVDINVVESTVKRHKKKYDYVTMIDRNYPEEYKGNYKPPIVLRKRKKNQNDD